MLARKGGVPNHNSHNSNTKHTKRNPQSATPSQKERLRDPPPFPRHPLAERTEDRGRGRGNRPGRTAAARMRASTGCSSVPGRR